MNSDDRPHHEASLARVRIVLSHPTEPGNIGAAVRALATMGLRRLVLVDPKRFPDPQATAMAAGAARYLGEVEVRANLDQALAGATLSIALTARRRDLSPPLIDLRDAADLAIAEARAGGEVALLFGTEVSGLSNEEVLRCQRAARIGTSEEFSSLNLAAAVQVVAYALRHAAVGRESYVNERTPPATHEELEGLFAHLEASLQRSGFLDAGNPRRVMQRLRRLFARAQLESQEVNVLRGMLSAWDEALRGRTKR
ncbi:MAG TPA: TrmJ/YjtD family RNA methyltransferase [Burkholderiales bacterium]|nr:TrmJ/YjtD family RNA methyltransferase [Burkholderiales bacterium]